MLDYLKAWSLYVLPHHLLSRLIFKLTRLRSPAVPWFIRQFCRVFRVNLSEAEYTKATEYESFNAFFTRRLQPHVRPLAVGERQLISPVDGTISEMGSIKQGQLLQAKHYHYTVRDLLGGSAAQSLWFEKGQFLTAYLSPRDYHRIHMPADGRLLDQIHVPGRLFSVAPHTVNTIPGLFTRNERVVCLFDTPFGKMALVLVGAINVAAIETVWSGLVTPPSGKVITRAQYPEVRLQKGDEMGRFNMGSTVIILLESEAVWSEHLKAGTAIQFGQPLASMQPVT